MKVNKYNVNDMENNIDLHDGRIELVKYELYGKRIIMEVLAKGKRRLVFIMDDVYLCQMVGCEPWGKGSLAIYSFNFDSIETMWGHLQDYLEEVGNYSDVDEKRESMICPCFTFMTGDCIRVACKELTITEIKEETNVD